MVVGYCNRCQAYNVNQGDLYWFCVFCLNIDYFHTDVCLIAVSEVASEFEYVSSLLGDQVIFPCKCSSSAGVEWRCGKDKQLIYSSGRILSPFVWKFSIQIEEGWYNLTEWMTSLSDTSCSCFDADDGRLIKEYKIAVFAGDD